MKRSKYIIDLRKWSPNTAAANYKGIVENHKTIANTTNINATQQASLEISTISTSLSNSSLVCSLQRWSINDSIPLHTVSDSLNLAQSTHAKPPVSLWHFTMKRFLMRNVRDAISTKPCPTFLLQPSTTISQAFPGWMVMCVRQKGHLPFPPGL